MLKVEYSGKAGQVDDGYVSHAMNIRLKAFI
jgi:hypothetical protein